MEANVIKCPNCGASANNHMNCEYCGSLLVRFVDKSIDIKDSSYIDNSIVFPCLIDEFQKNLMLQDNSEEEIATEICWVDKKGNKDDLLIASAAYYSEEDQPNNKDKGLEILIDFNRSTNPESYSFDMEKDKQLAKFTQLKSFPLFTPNFEQDEDWLIREFKINFGQDSEGAARLISEILIKVKGLSLSDSYDIFTTVGDEFNKAEAAWYRSHGFPGWELTEDAQSLANDGVEVVDDNSEDTPSIWKKLISIFN